MRILASHGWRWGFWFRVFGYGLVVSDARPSFSERNGFTRALRIGRWGISTLRPEEAQQGKISARLGISVFALWALSLWFAYALGFNNGQSTFASQVHWMPLPGPEAEGSEGR